MSNIQQQQISIRLESFIRDLHEARNKRNIAKAKFEKLETMRELNFIPNFQSQVIATSRQNTLVAERSKFKAKMNDSLVLKAMEDYFKEERELQLLYNTIRTVTSDLDQLRSIPGPKPDLLEVATTLSNMSKKRKLSPDQLYSRGGKKKTKKRKTLKKKLKKKSYKKNKKYKYNKRKQTIKKN